MKTYTLPNGKKCKVFTIHAFNRNHDVIVTKGHYHTNRALALQVWEIDPNSNDLESFGTLTVNLYDSPVEGNFAYVKNYSENKDWAESLAKMIGGKNTGKKAVSGYVSIPLYDFTNLNIEEE